MPTRRICSFNGEWMNDWFTPDAEAAAFRPTFVRDNHVNNTAQTVGRAGALLRALDADIIALQEAPSRAAELAIFIQDQLSDNGGGALSVLSRRLRWRAEAGASLQARLGDVCPARAVLPDRDAAGGMACRYRR